LKRRDELLVLSFVFLFLTLLCFNWALGQSYQAYQPSWLHVGVSATYAFGPESTIYFNNSMAYGGDISGNCSWTVTGVQNGLANVTYEINVVIPGANTPEEQNSLGASGALVLYTGKPFVDSAENGNFSFVTTLPADQVNISRGFIVNNNPPGTYLVGFWGGFNIDKVFNITVNLQNLTMVDQNGVPWGKWLYWINPLFYPVDQTVQETALYDWAGTQVNRSVAYVLPGSSKYLSGRDTPVGNFTAYYYATISPIPITNPELVTPGENIFLFQGLVYEPRTGLLLESASPNYVDDVFSQKMGILEIWPSGHFWLTQLQGVSFTVQEATPQPNYIPYLAVAGVAAGAILVFLGYRRRSKR
jgi:hypothetical protein